MTRQTVIGDASGEGLDEIDRFALDDRNHPGGHLGVVDGTGQVVAGGVDRQVQVEVDDEGLRVCTLAREHPVASHCHDPAYRDVSVIDHGHEVTASEPSTSRTPQGVSGAR